MATFDFPVVPEVYNKAARSFCARGTVAKSSDAEDAFSNIVPVELLFNVSKPVC